MTHAFHKAAIPSADLSVMKSDCFKHNSQILSIMHLFWSEQNTSTTLFKPTWTTENSNQHTLHHHRMEYPAWRFHNTWIFVWYSSLKVCLWVFESFYWWPRAPFSTAFHFGMTAANELKNGSCILPGSVLAESEVLSMGKWTKHYDWPASLKCKSRLAVAQPQESVICWRTLSLPLNTGTHRYEHDHFIIYLHIWGNGFIMGIIA